MSGHQNSAQPRIRVNNARPPECTPLLSTGSVFGVNRRRARDARARTTRGEQRLWKKAAPGEAAAELTPETGTAHLCLRIKRPRFHGNSRGCASAMGADEHVCNPVQP